jgi:membrane fusion protein (multidrug efflux system)
MRSIRIFPLSRRRLLMRSLAVALLGLLGALSTACSDKNVTQAAVPEVYFAEVVQRSVPIYMEIVGQTQGSQDVDIRARVEGFLDTINFIEGAYVHTGDLLYQIDPKPLQAALAQAKANLATSQARLDQATVTVNRMKPLAAQQAVSLQELDNAMATQNAAIAQVDADRAAVDKAELDLGYTRITSPIDGIVGITEVKAGNLVGSGESTLLTTVSKVDPIIFRGGISEADYLKLARSKESRMASHAGAPIGAELILADGSIFPHPGSLEAIERAVDPTTGTLSIQIAFPNPERLLRPGQYGRVRFASEIRNDALLVLQRAVQELQDRFNVFVVDADNKVSLRTVKVGPRVGDLWVIDEGLQPGERVVVEGLQRLRDGMTVAAAPVAAPAPTPADPAATDKVEY